MPRDMVADPFMSAGEARVLQAKEAGFEPHNLSESQLVIMQQPEDLVAKRAAAAAHLALYGDDHMSSDQIQRARGEGDIFAASPAPLGVRKKDPSAAGGPSSLEVAKANSRKKTGACAVNLADINDETSDFDYPKKRAQKLRRQQQQAQPQGAGKTTVSTNLQRTYDPSNAQQRQQRPAAAGGKKRMPTGHGHPEGQVGATVFGYAIVPSD